MLYTPSKLQLIVLLCLIVTFALLTITPALAQKSSNKVISQRIVRPMIPLDTVTLQAEGIKIRLWGIKAAHTSETPLELNALMFVEKIIGNEHVNCKVANINAKEPVARCLVHTNEDLGLALLQAGYAVVDRHQTYNSVFASSYEDAQTSARIKRVGIWKFASHKETENLIPAWLAPYMPSLVPISLVFGPFFGLLFIALTTKRGFSKIVRRQRIEFNEAREKEDGLLRREKLILASALEGELSENKIKIEAFLTIYQNILNELTEDIETPKYQKGGDLIHKHPSLTRTVFEGSISKLSALDMHMASTLSKLYAHIYAEPDYNTIDPSTPLPDVINMTKQVIKEAEDLAPEIDYAIEQLQETMQQQLETGSAKKKAA